MSFFLWLTLYLFPQFFHLYERFSQTKGPPWTAVDLRWFRWRCKTLSTGPTATALIGRKQNSLHETGGTWINRPFSSSGRSPTSQKSVALLVVDVAISRCQIGILMRRDIHTRSIARSLHTFVNLDSLGRLLLVWSPLPTPPKKSNVAHLIRQQRHHDDDRPQKCLPHDMFHGTHSMRFTFGSTVNSTTLSLEIPFC